MATKSKGPYAQPDADKPHAKVSVRSETHGRGFPITGHVHGYNSKELVAEMKRHIGNVIDKHGGLNDPMIDVKAMPEKGNSFGPASTVGAGEDVDAPLSGPSRQSGQPATRRKVLPSGASQDDSNPYHAVFGSPWERVVPKKGKRA